MMRSMLFVALLFVPPILASGNSEQCEACGRCFLQSSTAVGESPDFAKINESSRLCHKMIMNGTLELSVSPAEEAKLYSCMAGKIGCSNSSYSTMAFGALHHIMCEGDSIYNVTDATGKPAPKPLQPVEIEFVSCVSQHSELSDAAAIEIMRKFKAILASSSSCYFKCMKESVAELDKFCRLKSTCESEMED